MRQKGAEEKQYTLVQGGQVMGLRQTGVFDREKYLGRSTDLAAGKEVAHLGKSKDQKQRGNVIVNDLPITDFFEAEKEPVTEKKTQQPTVDREAGKTVDQNDLGRVKAELGKVKADIDEAADDQADEQRKKHAVEHVLFPINRKVNQFPQQITAPKKRQRQKYSARINLKEWQVN